uniref:Smoothelin domain-containing protein n=1 Tax=Timema genevievae TaxID=629358 RepID=A0A7R9JR48_TIMGE|nr:unnamed protein product [Timema genevievae]
MEVTTTGIPVISGQDKGRPSSQGHEITTHDWQQTEDFGRKKEIRARMYKLREQRLKEFYTTGEVLHDVLSSTSSLDDSSAVRQVKSGGSNTRYHSSSDISSSQKKDQVVSKNSSYTMSSSIRHADSLSDDSFLTLKSKEIRDSESPTREFHKRQEKNVSDDDGYWRVVQESSSGAYEESGTIRDGVETTIHSKYKTEQSRTAGDSTDGLSTTTRVASSQEKANIPSDGNSQNESSISSCVVQKGGDIGGDLISSNSASQFGKWSSTSSSSFVTQGQQQEQMTSSSSSSRAISSSIQNGQDISSHYILDSSNSAKDDSSLIKELSTSVSEIGQNIIDVSSKRVTQRSQTSDFIIDENLIISECDRVSTTGQNTNVSTSIDRSPLIDKNTIIDFNISINDTFTTGTSVSEEKSSKVVEQKIMSELHKLDSFLSTQNATDSTPVSPHDARDSASWTIVSSTSKHRNCQDVPDQGIIDEFVFRSGNADNIKDTTNLQSKEFIDQEKNSSLIVTNEKVLIDKETKIYVDGTPQKIVHNTGKSPTEELKGTSNRTSNQETTTAKPTEGQYITTYKQDYTNKRISVDVSPTHEAFARSLRASPEHGTPNSTRSSSKVSLDRSSPEKSPSKSPYRNRTSADNSLSSPNRSSPEKSTVRPSSARSSPEKINKTYPSRISPEKTGPTNISSQKTQSISSPDKISSPRLSPDKFTASNSERTVPGRIGPEKSINKVPATRVSPESTTTSARLSPDRKSPQKDTINKTDRSSPARRSPEKMMPGYEQNTQTGKLQRQPERRVSSADRPREPSAVYSPTRKLSDSTRITITNKDINVQTASVKERRKFSSGATRASTKKRSSTPGVSPSLSPSREDDINLRMPSQDVITEKPHAIDKVLSPNKYPNTTPEATVRSAQSSPERKIPARQNESPKSVLDKLTRDKSPEYSSEGSLIHEFSYKQNDEKSAFTQVKQKKESHRESLDSSPERNNFTPIKVFKTTPETSSQENEPADETKTSPSTAKSPVQQSSVTFSSKKAEPLKTVYPIPKQGQDMPSDREPIKPDKPLSSRPEYFQEKDTSTQQYYKDTEQITTLENDESLSSCDYPKQNEKPSHLLQETSKPNIYNVVGEHPDNIEISPKGYGPEKYSRKPEMQNTKNFIENEIQESQKVSGKHDKTINKSRRSTSSDTKSSSVSPCSSSPERPKISTSTSRVEITLRPTPKGHLSKNSLPPNERPGKEIPVTGRESPQKRFTTTKQVPSPIRNKPKRPAMDSDETPDSSPERTPRGKIITKTPSKIRLLKPDKNNDAASRLPSKPSVTSVKTNTSPRSEQNTSAPIKKDKPFERKLSEKSIPSLSRVSDRPQNQRTNKVITRIPSSTDSSLRHGRAPEKPSEVSRSKKDIQKITKLQTNVQYSVDIIPHKNYSVRKPESSPEGRSPSLSPERVIPSSSSRYPSYKRSPITSPERQIIPKTIKTVDDNRVNIPKRASQFPSPDRHTRIPIQGKHTKSPTSPRYPADIIRKPSDHISQISGQNKPSHKPDNSRAHYSSPSSSPDRTQQRITRFTATVKVNPVDKNVDTAKETKLHKTRKSPDDIDDRSTDRSSTISSPETVKTAEDIVEELYENISEKRKLTEIHLDNLPEKRDLSPSDQEKDVPTLFTNKNNDYFESSTVINNRAHTLRQNTYDVNQHNEYITDDYDVDDVQDETPPEEFIVDDDSPVHLAPKLSSIPMRKQNLKPNQPYIEKSPLTKQIKSKPTPEKNTTVPSTKIIITTKSIPIKDVRNLNSRPISTKPTKGVSTILHQRSESRVPLRRDQSTASQSPRNVSTKDIKISRVNSDKNVIKHHITSPSNIQPKKQPSKSDITVPSERNKISSVTAHTSSTRHQQPTTKNVTSVRSFGIKNTKSTTTIQRPSQKPMVSKEEPNRRPMSIAVASTKRTTVTKEKTADKKHLNTKKIVPTKEHYTSPFFSEDEQEVPDIVDSEDRERFSEQEDDETDQEYIKELEDLRQTEEQLYASKYVGTPKEDDKIFLQLEKVTDLDEEPDTDEALKSVSVANRVSLFLEEAKKTTAPHKSPQLVEESKKPMDSPTSVRKAKLMFENIAHTQKSPVKSPQSPRKNIPDIVDRPSVFEARRGGKVTSPVKDEDFIHTEKQDESNYYDHSRRTSHYTNDEKHTGEDIPIKPLVTKHKTSPTAPSDDEDDFDDAESFTQDEIKQSRRPSSTQEHPSDIKSRKPQTTAKLSNRSISPALKNIEYQHSPKDTAPIARKPSGTTRRPSYTSPEVSNEQIKSRDDLPSTKISSDTYTRRKPSFPDRVVSPKPHDVAPDQNISSDRHYNEKTLSSEHPVHRRPSTPSHKDYSHENKIPKEKYSKHKPSSPERTTNFKPRAESPPRKISTDTIIRKISTPKEVPTEPFNKRQPTSSNKPREISPVNKISTATLTRRKPTSPDRSIEEPSKICTDTYSRGRPKYPEQTVDKNYGTYTKVRPSTKQESAGRFDTFTVKGKSIGKKVVPEDENKTISKDYISRKESSPVDVYSEPKKSYLQETFSSRKHAHEDLSSDEDSSKRNNFILSKTVDNSFERIPDEFPEDSHFYADTDKEPTIGYLQDTFSSRKHARDDSQSDDDTTHGRDSLPRKIPDNICSAKIVDDFPEDRHFYPSKSRRDVSPADKDTSSIRRYSKEQPKDITTKQYSPTRKGASPTREILSKKEQSPARDYPRRDYSPSSKKSPSPSPTRKDFTHRASFSTNKDAITRRESAHRPENISSLRKDSLPKDKPKSLASKYLAKVEQKFPLKTVDVRPGGKFGVSLRQTNVTTSTLQRRQSGDVTKTKSCAPNGEEVIVEDIFDLELLEMMLERAVLYDERSAIRAQIRIVRRTMSESTTTTTTTTKTTKSTSSVEVTQRLSGREAPRPTGDRDSPRRRGSHERPDEAEPGRRPSSGYEPNTSDKTRAWRRSPERPGNAEPGRRPSSEYEPSISDKPQGRRVSHERTEDAVLGRRPSSGYEPNTSDKTRALRRSPERPGDVEPGRRPSSGYEPNTSDKPRARKSSPITQRFFPEEGRRRPSQDEGTHDCVKRGEKHNDVKASGVGDVTVVSTWPSHSPVSVKPTILYQLGTCYSRAAKAVFASEIFPQQKRSGARREDFAHKKDFPYKRRTQDRSQSSSSYSFSQVLLIHRIGIARNNRLRCYHLGLHAAIPVLSDYKLSQRAQTFQPGGRRSGVRLSVA